jgi:hypothetical protein
LPKDGNYRRILRIAQRFDQVTPTEAAPNNVSQYSAPETDPGRIEAPCLLSRSGRSQAPSLEMSSELGRPVYTTLSTSDCPQPGLSATWTRRPGTRLLLVSESSVASQRASPFLLSAFKPALQAFVQIFWGAVDKIKLVLNGDGTWSRESESYYGVAD